MSKKRASRFPRSAELTPEAAKIIDRIKTLTKIPKRYLIEEAIVNYLPVKYERRTGT